MVSALSLRNWIGLILGPLLAILIQFCPIPEALIDLRETEAAARQSWVVLSLLVLMAIWWVTEAIPIPVTSLLPLLILPICAGFSMKAASAEYMHPIVVLLLGGFIIAKAIEAWSLHERIALNIVATVGGKPYMLIGGFMMASAVLSMWISNTATSIMMIPIALSVAVALIGKDCLNSPFTYALLLGIAWACSIGGLGTPVGTPTNLIIIGYLNDNAGFEIGFLDWMMLGIPAVALLIPAAWLILTKWLFKMPKRLIADGQDVILGRLDALGRMSRAERRVMYVFMFIAVLWITRKFLNGIVIFDAQILAGLTDHGIAILGVVLCFLIPSGDKDPSRKFLLNWQEAERIPWGVLLLFGGGMSLASAMTVTELGAWLGGELSSYTQLPLWAIALLLTVFVIFATEITSNIATASALMPVLGAIAVASGLPIEFLAMPLALAASCAFMLPMATGPNAVIFATGHITLPQMARAGFWMNLAAIIIIVGLSMIWVPFVLA